MADSDNSGTGKVNHQNFKLVKILQSMTDSPEFDFIQHIHACCFHIFNYNGWLDGQIFTIHYMVQDSALIQSFTHMIALHVQRH